MFTLPFTALRRSRRLLLSLLLTATLLIGSVAASQAQSPNAPNGQSEQEVQKRLAVIRYLAGMDCRTCPEAEAALIAALRADPNENLRYEAALALTNANGCTKEMLEALVLCVSGSTKDQHPAETSPRVRNQAALALQHGLNRYTQNVTATTMVTTSSTAQRTPLPPAPPTAASPVAKPGLATGQHDLFSLLRNSVSPEP